MELTFYQDVQAFRTVIEPLLMPQEVENNLMLGTAIALAEGRRYSTDLGEQPLLCTVLEQGLAIAALLRTPPHLWQLMSMPPAITARLVAELLIRGIDVPGIVSPKETAGDFSAAWASVTRQQAILALNMRVYRLDRVISSVHSSGYARLAHTEEAALIAQWQDVPVGEILPRIENGQIQLWCDPDPVSVAAMGRRTPNGACISMVYTPPEHRNNGYATANVAVLSQRLLDTGFRFCCLFTDLAKHTPNRIYPKIGYRPVCDFAAYRFE